MLHAKERKENKTMTTPDREEKPLSTYPALVTEATERLLEHLREGTFDDTFDEQEAIRAFLARFALHIVENTTPVAGSPIKRYGGMTCEQIVAALPTLDAPDHWPFTGTKQENK